jgi:hypothetical protein
MYYGELKTSCKGNVFWIFILNRFKIEKKEARRSYEDRKRSFL